MPSSLNNRPPNTRDRGHRGAPLRGPQRSGRPRSENDPPRPLRLRAYGARVRGGRLCAVVKRRVNRRHPLDHRQCPDVGEDCWGDNRGRFSEISSSLFICGSRSLCKRYLFWTLHLLFAIACFAPHDESSAHLLALFFWNRVSPRSRTERGGGAVGHEARVRVEQHIVVHDHGVARVRVLHECVSARRKARRML